MQNYIATMPFCTRAVARRSGRPRRFVSVVPMLAPLVAVRRIRAVLALALALAVASLGWLLAAPAPAAAASLVALGDSYASGEGVGPYAAGTDGPESSCRRSPHAWPSLLAVRLRLLARSFACSGATTDEVTRPDPMRAEPERRTTQRERLARISDASLVTLTVGGNDAGFAEVVRRCLTGRCTRPAIRQALDRRLARLRRDLPGLYRVVAAAAPRATLVVVGYPRIFSRRTALPCLGITRTEAALLDAAAVALDRTLRAAARRAQARYVTVLGALAGHEVSCRGDAWVRGLVPDDPRASFHPTRRGHARLAQVVATTLAA